MSGSYEFEEQNSYSKLGIKHSCEYLNAFHKTVKVINVENNKNYQDRDVDLIWVTFSLEKGTEVWEIEVKIDSYTTGNFWLETISNDKTNSEGCFFKSKAKWYFYYFDKLDVLYIIPLHPAQEWLKQNFKKFKSSTTSTKNKVTKKILYNTVGRIVPIEKLEEGLKLKGSQLHKIENLSNIPQHNKCP